MTPGKFEGDIDWRRGCPETPNHGSPARAIASENVLTRIQELVVALPPPARDVERDDIARRRHIEFRD
jgi:hypothetical protein